MPFNLDISEWAEWRASNALGRLGLNRRVPVRIAQDGDLFRIDLPDVQLFVPSAKRWHNYRRGWQVRVDYLLQQFGVGDIMKLNADDVVIDIGANIGEFSLGVSRLCGKVHAIEGDPLVFRCLSRNALSNPTISCHETIVGNITGEVEFFSDPADANSSLIEPIDKSRAKKMKLSSIRLDEFSEKYGIDQVALIKCDAEGAEPEVIEGAERLLRRTRSIALDTGPERQGEETSDACEAMLRKLGFQVFHQKRLRRKITFGVRV